jgi:hypothetical protein
VFFSPRGARSADCRGRRYHAVRNTANYARVCVRLRVRPGYMWSGVEPAEGQFNTTYINIINNIVDQLAQRGIYTLLDVHRAWAPPACAHCAGADVWAPPACAHRAGADVGALAGAR